MAQTSKTREPVVAKAGSTGEPKHIRVRKDLLRRIHHGDYKPGDSFATERELIERYGISSVTARRSLNDLAHEGILVRRRGSGTYISEMATLQAQRALGVVCSSFSASLHTPFQTHLLAGLEEHLRGLGWRIGLMTTQGFEAARNPGLALAGTARQHAYDGLFIISPLPERWIEELNASDMPLVAINVEFPHVPLPCILMDMAGHVRRACDYLFGLGHRRIAALLGLMPGTDPTAPSNARSAEEELGRIRAERGDELQLSCAFYEYNDHASVERAVAPIVDAPAGERATAVIVSESEVAGIFEQKTREVGWTVPADASVVVIGKTLPSSPYTAVEPHLDNLCWRAIRIMEGLGAGHPPARLRELVGFDLDVRASTAPPPQDPAP